jgi:hypothetical protein
MYDLFNLAFSFSQIPPFTLSSIWIHCLSWLVPF